MNWIQDHKKWKVLQSPLDGHFEAWRTVGATEIKTSDGVAKVGRDVNQIVLPGRDINEAIEALDRKLARRKQPKESDQAMKIDFE